MKTFYKTFSSISMLFLVFQIGYAAQVSENKTTSISKEGVTTIQVKKNQPTFKITLDSNRTTGYRWLLGKHNPQFLESLSNTYQPKNSKLAGAGGKEEWVFRVKPTAFSAPTVITFEMIYARPWDMADQPSVKVFKVVTNS